MAEGSERPGKVDSLSQGNIEKQTTICSNSDTFDQFGVPNLLIIHVFGMREKAGELGSSELDDVSKTVDILL